MDKVCKAMCITTKDQSEIPRGLKSAIGRYFAQEGEILSSDVRKAPEGTIVEVFGEEELVDEALKGICKLNALEGLEWSITTVTNAGTPYKYTHTTVPSELTGVRCRKNTSGVFEPFAPPKYELVGTEQANQHVNRLATAASKLDVRDIVKTTATWTVGASAAVTTGIAMYELYQNYQRNKSTSANDLDYDDWYKERGQYLAKSTVSISEDSTVTIARINAQKEENVEIARINAQKEQNIEIARINAQNAQKEENIEIARINAQEKIALARISAERRWF
jgi:hypothetical protein